MLTTGLAALDTTVVSTAVPSIVRDLGGFSDFPWVFSVYLLTQAVTVPIYGRLADVKGRKPVIFTGIAIFLAGSFLSGLSWGMPTLIVFRGIQGIGAGAVLPMSMTIIGDIYTVRERGRIQGYISAVWGMAAIIGPPVGGILSQYASWRWIFYLNAPVGGLAAVMLARHLREEVPRKAHSIDYLGAGVLITGMALLVLAVLNGGAAWGWTSPEFLTVSGTGLLLLSGFAAIERRISEPILPPWVWSRRTLVAGSLASAATGALVTGLSAYVPVFAQGVARAAPVLAGLALAGELTAWVLGSIISGRLYVRVGFRKTAVLGSLACCGGMLAFLRLGASTDLLQVALVASCAGLGFGLVSPSVLVAMQSSVGWDRRGVVTGANMFGRNLGSAFGVAVFGSLANFTLARWLRSPAPAIAAHLPKGISAASFVLGGTSGIRNAVAADYVRYGLFVAAHRIFWSLEFAAIALLVTVWFLPAKDAAANQAALPQTD
jgi:EmrB/QacA subfamily drug resistance transporter